MNCVFSLFILMLAPSILHADMIIGGDILYTVKKGDTIEKIGAKLALRWTELARENNIDITKYLKVGRQLGANTRKIVPMAVDEGIIINIPDRMLYYFKNGLLDEAFPVGLGRADENRRWRTPTGKFNVLRKAKNPTWHVPESMQAEMKKAGEEVRDIVPPGPDNPLGRYAIGISMPALLIHETIWPGSVYQFRSHGCIRVLTEHMEGFFDKIAVNTPGEIIYMPVKVAVTENGNVYMEAHRDVYERLKSLEVEAERIIKERGLAEKVNWRKVEKVLKEKSGTAEDVTL